MAVYKMPDPDAVAGLMEALSDRTRLCILVALADGETNVGALCGALALPQPTVSYHLGILRVGGFVTARRQKKKVYYRLGPEARSPSAGVVEVGAGRAAVRVTLPPNRWRAGHGLCG
jgi:DNA-binding transcriptional ArsR family regulator